MRANKQGAQCFNFVQHGPKAFPAGVDGSSAGLILRPLRRKREMRDKTG